MFFWNTGASESCGRTYSAAPKSPTIDPETVRITGDSIYIVTPPRPNQNILSKRKIILDDVSEKVPVYYPRQKKQKITDGDLLKEKINLQLINRSEKVKTFVNAQLFHTPRQHWTKDERDLALKQYFISPAFYRSLIADGFHTPSIATIYRWHSMIRFAPGISSEMEQLLSAKCIGMSELNRKCVLNFDEMSSKVELQYNEKVSKKNVYNNNK